MRRLENSSITVWLMLGGVLFCFLIIGSSCKDDGVGPTPVIQLRLEEVTCTEAWLRVTVTDMANQPTLTIKRDEQPIATMISTPHDTLIIDENLQPGHSYTYTIVPSTPTLTVTTLPVTSHDFSFTIDTLGDGNSSALYDVVILNDTLAYAVGEIYKKDSTGKFENEPYGLATWNGRKWNLQRLYALSPTGTYYSVLSPRGIYVFSQTNIWFASGGVFQWNGEGEYVTPYWINAFPGNPNPIFFQGQSSEKLWGTSSSNLYVVGTNGAIAYYNGSLWRKIEGETNVSINDIFGQDNTHLNKPFILAGASNVATQGERKILTINRTNTVDTLPWEPGRRIHSLWFLNEKQIFTAGGGVFVRHANNNWQEFTEIPSVYTRRIRGNSTNDIFVVGDFGIAAHFNGKQWHLYPELTANIYYSCDYKNNFFVTVGQQNGKAVIVRGYKN